MSTVFVFKGIKPARLRVDAIRQEILNELRAEGRDQRKELEKTTATWQGEKPKFETLIGLDRAEGASVLTGPVDTNPMGFKKWNWLNKGTAVRRAVMSRDWKSKTRPGHVGSGAGRGRVVFISKRIRRPGIKARGWTEIISKRRKRPFQQRMIQAMRRGASKAF